MLVGWVRGKKNGRVDVSEPASISTGIASRYATAIFELAKDDNAIDTVESDVDTLAAALKDSEDFRELISSPVYSRDQQEKAITLIGKKMGLSQIVANTLRLMATKRRLFVLPQLVQVLRARIAREKGVVTAEVVAARELSDEQRQKLTDALKEAAGGDVKIELSVDKNLIGGLRVQLGSKMIDTSIRSKLAALKNTMKEAG